MGKREELYLKPGMNEAALLEEFKTRNNYYYVIASQLVADVKRYVEGSSWVDFLGRGGSVSWQVTRAGASSVFLDYRESFVTQAGRNVRVGSGSSVLSGATTLDEALSLLGDIPDVDAVLCLEQMSLLQEKIESFTGALAKLKQRNQNMVFGGTMGPSHHPFNTYNLDDYRRRDVAENGKMMTELCHPIHKAAHDAILEIAKERYGYTGADVYPHTKPFDLPALKQSFEEAGFANLALIEDAFEVGGEEIVHYLQNGWTFFFRFPPFADLPTDEKIAILIEAIEKVRAMPEYDEWCAIAAHHPVAYYIAW